MESVFAFDADTAVEPAGPGCWWATITDRWDIGAVPNGGYVLAVALAAVRSSVRQPHPLTATAHYLSPCDHGPVEVAVDVVKEGRNLSTATARIVQGGRARLQVVATYGDLAGQNGPTLVTARAPDLPAPDDCATAGDLPMGGNLWRPAIHDRIDFRPSPTTTAGLRKRGAAAQIAGWIRFRDERPIDVECLPLFVDGTPPAVFAAIETGWVPTLELTVHVRAVPAPGWLAVQAKTQVLVDGLLEEECELWDSAGRLVAMSRQLARVLSPDR